MSQEWQAKQLLLLRFADGELSADERAQVAEMLKSDPKARAFLREIAEQAVVFADLERIESTHQARRETPATLADSKRGWNGRSAHGSSGRFNAYGTYGLATIASICALLLAGLFLGYDWWTSRDSGNLIAITGASGPLQWTGDGGQVQIGVEKDQAFGGGTLEALSANAWVAFEFGDGSTVTMSGNSSISVAGTVDGKVQKKLHFRKGNISADVVPQPANRPMLVQTPTANLEVLGTQFNVDAESSSTVLTVNEGRVRCTRLADGAVEEVPANYRLEAAASRYGQLKAAEQQSAVATWRSRLPQGIRYGKWRSARDGSAGLSASPLLWRSRKSEGKKRVLLFVASLEVSHGDQPPVELLAGSKFRIHGSIDSQRDVVFGLTTQYMNGGFAGKHLAMRRAGAFADGGGEFSFDVGIEEFKPRSKNQPESPIGLGLDDWWCLTVHEDAGLTINSVELIPEG